MADTYTARIAPSPATTPHTARMSFNDMVRAALFLAIPLYARFYSFASVLNIVGHLYIIGTTLISAVYLSNGALELDLSFDIFYGPMATNSPAWTIYLLRLTWLRCNIES